MKLKRSNRCLPSATGIPSFRRCGGRGLRTDGRKGLNPHHLTAQGIRGQVDKSVFLLAAKGTLPVSVSQRRFRSGSAKLKLASVHPSGGGNAAVIILGGPSIDPSEVCATFCWRRLIGTLKNPHYPNAWRGDIPKRGALSSSTAFRGWVWCWKDGKAIWR